MIKQNFKPVNPKVNFPLLENEVITYWKKNKIFEKSVEQRPEEKKWTFLDGPPFITGLPHYGTLLSSIPKDLFPRYWAMKGYRVRRVWGWDCHGLPAENKVEEKLGIKRKKDIEDKIGVKKFIDECKLYVSQVSSEWEWYVDHIGRWVDFKNAYKTMDLPYMETVMWVFKQMYEKGLIYKGLRVSLYCPHCATPISNFEVAMDADNYREITESASTYKYQLADEKDTYLLAWSTTPWNKIVTPALAVNPKLKYVKVKQGKENYILAKTTLKMLNNQPYKIIEEFSGQELLGKKFIPHYDFYKIEKGKKAFVVIGGDFVTAEEGTGIVTIAAYGEEDLAVMQKEDIQIVLHVDEEGILKPEVPKWAGMSYLDVNKEVNNDLNSRGLLYKEEQYTHTLPVCWRCHTRLYYAPQNAWYVNIQNLKEKMRETNKAVNWFPKHFKYGRFLKSMEAAPDWCISRSRYWGSPVPVWECQCGERIVPGSIAELEKLSGKKISDLHKPAIDQVTIKCPKCQKQSHRVSEVLDSWTEAGSAPFAERHFPFDKGVKLEDFFPPDFIVEYTGQIRAWFYVLHVIATALFDSNAFKNVVVTGVILGTDGRKMSKNYGNYPDPKEMLEKYGGDALRLYLMGSPVMHAEDIRISQEDYKRQASFLLVLWNVYNFFVTYALIDGWESDGTEMENPSHVLDRWILSRMNGSLKNVQAALEKYDAPEAVNLIKIFVVNDLSTWYVRRIRDRVGPTAKDGQDKNEAYKTLWTVLKIYSQVLAPMTPFISEKMFQNLTGEKSVHLTPWPVVNEKLIDDKLEKEMEIVRKVVELAHAQRKENSIMLRQPLASLASTSPIYFSQEVQEVIKDEVNVLEINHRVGDKIFVQLDLRVTADLKTKGDVRRIIREIQQARKEAGCGLAEKVKVTLPDWPKDYTDYIKKETLAEELVRGDKLEVVRSGKNESSTKN